MYGIMIWNDLEGDFILHRVNGKVVMFDSWAEATEKADTLARDTGEQTKVQFVRNTKGPKKTNRNGRVRRYKAVLWGGEWVAIVKTLDSNGKRVKA